MTHYGLSFNGTISHNAFLFNQSQNPTLTTNGGGLIVEGAAPDGTLAENSQIDVDGSPALSDGIGSGNVVDANLIMGNTAESGEGGGLRLQSINGNDVFNNPNAPSHWYALSVTNNIIVNNVAGWNGGGVSIQDAVKVDFRNNTVASNDSTASAGWSGSASRRSAGRPPRHHPPDRLPACCLPPPQIPTAPTPGWWPRPTPAAPPRGCATATRRRTPRAGSCRTTPASPRAAGRPTGPAPVPPRPPAPAPPRGRPPSPAGR